MIFSKLTGAALLLAASASASPMEGRPARIRRLGARASASADTAAGATPSPVQDGMVSGCTKFALVATGDTCQSIADGNGITLANFYAWNAGVGSSCQTLWADAYVCVAAAGGGSSGGASPTGTGAAGATPTGSAADPTSTDDPEESCDADEDQGNGDGTDDNDGDDDSCDAESEDPTPTATGAAGAASTVKATTTAKSLTTVTGAAGASETASLENAGNVVVHSKKSSTTSSHKTTPTGKSGTTQTNSGGGLVVTPFAAKMVKRDVGEAPAAGAPVRVGREERKRREAEARKAALEKKGNEKKRAKGKPKRKIHLY